MFSCPTECDSIGISFEIRHEQSICDESLKSHSSLVLVHNERAIPVQYYEYEHRSRLVLPRASYRHPTYLLVHVLAIDSSYLIEDIPNFAHGVKYGICGTHGCRPALGSRKHRETAAPRLPPRAPRTACSTTRTARGQSLDLS